MTQLADKVTPDAASAAPVTRIAAASGPPAPRGRSIPYDGGRLFLTEAPINGQRINFMVDCGASVVAFTEAPQRAAAYFSSHGDCTTNVTTANAHGCGRLAMVEVGGLVLHDVDAMVLPDEALSENLLGHPFL